MNNTTKEETVELHQTHLSDVKFADLPLLPELKSAITEMGFEFCTPIQAKTLPISLEGRDIAGQAQTGTGKTAAFLLAAFQHLIKHPKPNKNKRNQSQVRFVILAPTRELAIQIAKDAEKLSKNTELKIALAYGGTGYDQQQKAIEAGVDVLIGTPGRIIDYWKKKVFSLHECQGLVLDEADRMLDLGFIQDIRFLLRRLPDPGKRLSMMFSATLSHRVMELSYEHMNQPEKLEIKAEAVNTKKIAQYVYYPSNDEKIPLLIGLIQKLKPERAIVFVNTKRNAETIDDYLRGNDIQAVLISGDVRQNKRQSLLKEFAAGKHQVLIATDVAARGLHIDDVSHVFNYDLPQIAEDYVHRIGRTARAGASGEAHSFACEDTAFYLPEIEEYIGMSIEMASVTAELLADDLKPRKRITRDRVPQRPNNNGNKPGQKHSGKPRNGGGYKGKNPRNKSGNQSANKTANKSDNKPKAS
ncbi:ATP-dependent RNA helicase RhlB [Cocleimonas flava]|uniref:ATP-dependent RNA helicase RhlB n=1 Tax=Cocleimonas flava TaxID=634765 RepID=A0A4R1F3R8_9GAMM|nr:DEAD/DEAH box helicase [Cocleimonas flava]TCJ87099.1 ATP-dependent RNA helicase RhlB [Cocleimonas flava]